MIVNRNPRNYEVSIWTLQDGFITVLKSPYLEHKGQIEEPELSLKNDSEDTFSFRIPMYIRRNGQKIENPNWFNISNGNLIADMRKLKVIFNKNEKDERVFEFLITKVTEKHDGFETWCEVESEGLAFHELGKTGYKIELSSDIYNLEYNEWADNDGDPESEPINNINYWIDKVLDNTKWNYKIQMDWSGYSNRQTEKIYEDAYVSNWTTEKGTIITEGGIIIPENGVLIVERNILTPSEIIESSEKLRLVEGKESNRFNLLQNIAETFGVYCKFQYEYDDNYHIINRTVIFYNNFFQENEKEVFDLTYHYDTDDITREMDSTELITKMIVLNQNLELDNSIMNIEANPLLEDYLLNFDYLYSIGAINEEQYDAIKEYNAIIHELNIKISRLNERIMSYNNILIHAQAIVETAKQSLVLDQEGMQEEEAYINYLLDKSGGDIEAKVLHVTPSTAKPQYPIGEERYVIPPDKYTINVKVFSDSDCTVPVNEVLYERDEEGFCTKILNIPADIKLVYLTYDYSPDLYHKIVYEQWKRKFNTDKNTLIKYQPIVEKLNGARDNATNELLNENEPGLIEECNILLKKLLEEKNKEIIKFENIMGPALREGTWQPEDSYAKYGDHQITTISFNNPIQKNISLIWDENLFDIQEENNYYEEGAELEKVYYPCIDASNILNKLSRYIGNETIIEDENTVKQFGLIINDKIKQYDTVTLENNTTEQIETTKDNYKIFQIKYSFIKRYNSVFPVLIITDILDYYNTRNINTSISLEDYLKNLEGKIGYLITSTIKDENGVISMIQTVEEEPALDDITLISNINEYKTVYPRIAFNTYNLKTSSDELKINYNDTPLEVNYDYYILTKYSNEDDGSNIDWSQISVDIDNENYSYNYYITFRPEVFFKEGSYNYDFNIKYTLNNTGLMIYLDAIKILKENSMPKVSYTITPKIIKKDFIKYLYLYMHHLVHINDYELKFNNVMGYISEIKLKLDTPWEDEIEIKNYKTKFEDLFTSIVASTEEMKKNSSVISTAASMFTINGNLNQETLQNSISSANLNYTFNDGKLIINEKDGILSTNENGVIAFNGSGIFTATEKDNSGNWIWNTGILPRGISANAITAGQLDTNLIRIYAGDDLRFQMNAEGLFAYKSWLDDYVKIDENNDDILNNAKTYNDRNPGQYVVHNADGLFLIAEAGSRPIYEKIATISMKIGDQDINWPVLKDIDNIEAGFQTLTYRLNTPLDKTIQRVAISWDGLKLSNWQGEPTFYASPDTGDLIIKGTLVQNASYVTIPTNILAEINKELEQQNTSKFLKRGFTKDILSEEDSLLSPEDNIFKQEVIMALANDFNNANIPDYEPQVKFLAPDVAALKVDDYVVRRSNGISSVMIDDAMVAIENEYKPIINNISNIEVMEFFPENPKKFETIKYTGNDEDYVTGNIYWWDGENWVELKSTNINLGTSSSLNLFGANATFAAGSELKMLAGGKLHLFGGEVYISSDATIDITSTNFNIHSNPTNNNPFFSVGSNEANYLEYNKDNELSIKGNIIAESGSIGGWQLNDGNLYSTTEAIKLIAEENNESINIGNFRIKPFSNANQNGINFQIQFSSLE